MLKKILAVSLAGILALGLTACGNSEKAGETGKEKLVVWSMGADEQKKATEEMRAAFEKAHPEIEVEHSVIPTSDHVWDQKMTAALSAGTGPDVMMMSPDYYGLYSKYFVDLNPYVEKDGIDLDSVITEGMAEPYYRPDGKLEAMPLYQNCFVLAYNKDMFDSVGVEYPADDWTWDDVAMAAKQFVGGEGADAVYGIVNHWVDPNLAVIAKGGRAYSEDLKTCEINSDAVKAGLMLFGDLVHSKAMPDDAAAKGLPKEQLFVSGHAAMYTLGGFETKLIADEIGDNFNWDVAVMPKAPDGGKNNLLYAGGYAMLETSKNKDAAWTFLKEASFGNEDMGKAVAAFGMPSNKKVAESFYKEIKNGPIDNSKYLEGLSAAKLNIWGGALSAPGDVWTQIWQSVTIDGKTADEAMEEYYPALEKAFNEAMNK